MYSMAGVFFPFLTCGKRQTNERLFVNFTLICNKTQNIWGKDKKSNNIWQSPKILSLFLNNFWMFLFWIFFGRETYQLVMLPVFLNTFVIFSNICKFEPDFLNIFLAHFSALILIWNFEYHPLLVKKGKFYP